MGPGHCACCQLMETWGLPSSPLPSLSLPPSLPPHLPYLSPLPAHTASLCILPRPPSSPAQNPVLSLSPGPVQELERHVPVSWASSLPRACREGPSLAEGPEPRLAHLVSTRLRTQSPGRSSAHFPEPSEAAAQRPASLSSWLLPEEAVRAP